MTLTDEMARRIADEAFSTADRRPWEREDEDVKAVFRRYARAAQGALVDCEDFDEILPLLSSAALAEAVRRARQS